MPQTPITLSHKFPMANVVDIFRKLGPRYAIITKHGKLHGLITRKDVLRHLAFMHRFEVKEGAEAVGEEAAAEGTAGDGEGEKAAGATSPSGASVLRTQSRRGDPSFRAKF